MYVCMYENRIEFDMPFIYHSYEEWKRYYDVLFSSNIFIIKILMMIVCNYNQEKQHIIARFLFKL